MDDFVVTVPLEQLPVQAGNHIVPAQVSFDPSLNVEIIDSDYSVTVKLVPIVVEPIVRSVDPPEEN